MNGVAQLDVESIAMGLGFYQTKNGSNYIRWETINYYLNGFGFSQQVGKGDFIPENAFYLLAMKANSQAAQRFQMLVANEILPSIRRTGSYSIQPKSEDEKIYEAMNIMAKRISSQAARIAEMEHKETVYDTCMEAKNGIDLGIVARMFGYGRNTFFAILKQHKILMENRTPYQEYSHYFKMVENPKVDKYGNVRVFPAPLLLQPGLEFIARKIGKQYQKRLAA